MILGFIPGAPGPFEFMIFAAIILLVFGKRLPGVMRSVGQSIVEFKKGANDANADPSAEAEPPANVDEARKDD